MCYSNNKGEANFRLPAHKKGIPIYCVLLKNKRLIRVFKSMNDLEEYLNMEGIQYSGSLMRGNFLIYENDLDVISTVNGNIEFDLKGEVSYG